MSLRHALLGLASLLASTALAPAFAEQRVALVIGNSAYTAVPRLPNTTNDARAMTQLLGDAGFEVTSALDQSQAEMRRTIGAFAATVQAKGPDTVAAVFYAGHGLQVDGENFLVPIDLDPKIEQDLAIQAVRFNDLLNTLASVPSKMRIIMVDACRSNPFPQLKANMGRGLAVVDAKSGSTGSFLAYSTSPGTDAEDGTGNNSPYTTALLQAAREPGLSIEDAFKRVRVQVTQATDGRQIPWESSSLTTGFQFFTGASAAPTPPVSADRRDTSQWRAALQGKRAEDAFALVVADDTVPAYEAYVALYTAEPYGPRVRGILERRREMLFWNETLLLNTGAAYAAFLARFPNSDLAPTARRLEERTRNRALPVAGAVLPIQNASLAPACSCSPVKPAPAPKASKSERRAEPRPAPPRGRPSYVEEDVVYEPRPRPGVVIGVPVIGGGGYGGDPSLPPRGGYGNGPTRAPVGNVGRY